MKKPFKFRYVHEIVGSFVLLVVAAVIVAIVLAGRAQGWFEPAHEVRLEFPEEGTFGVRRGTEVRVMEAPAGTVQDIQVREDGVMVGVLRVRDRFYQYVRQDSQAIVRRVFGVAGDAYVEITRGVGDPLPEDEPYLEVERDTEIMDIAEDILEQLMAVTVPALEQLRILLEEYTELASDVRDPEREVQQLLVKINEAMDDVNRILANVAEASDQFPEMAETVGGEVRDVPGLVSQSQRTLEETETLIEGLQRHWLIRRYIDRDEPDPDQRLAPSAVLGAGGEE